MLTASHNPKNYNGLKFCMPGARPVGEDSGLREIRAMVEARRSPPAVVRGPFAARPAGRRTWNTCCRSSTSTPCSPLTVAVDTANGMGGLVVPAVMERLPGDARTTCTPSSTALSRTIRPTRSIRRTKGISKRPSLEHGADVGLAFDGDADRVFLVDEQRTTSSGSLLTALVADARCSAGSRAPRSSTT